MVEPYYRDQVQDAVALIWGKLRDIVAAKTIITAEGGIVLTKSPATTSEHRGAFEFSVTGYGAMFSTTTLLLRSVEEVARCKLASALL